MPVGDTDDDDADRWDQVGGFASRALWVRCDVGQLVSVRTDLGIGPCTKIVDRASGQRDAQDLITAGAPGRTCPTLPAREVGAPCRPAPPRRSGSGREGVRCFECSLDLARLRRHDDKVRPEALQPTIAAGIGAAAVPGGSVHSGRIVTRSRSEEVSCTLAMTTPTMAKTPTAPPNLRRRLRSGEPP